MSEYFPKPNHLGENAKTELDLSNYVTKADLKKETGIDTSEFPKKNDLDNLKSDIDKLDIEKLKNIDFKTSGLNYLKSKEDKLDIGKSETTLVDLSKLSDEVKTDVAKRTEYDELVLVKKVNYIKTTDTSDLIKKSDYNTKIGEIYYYSRIQ